MALNSTCKGRSSMRSGLYWGWVFGGFVFAGPRERRFPSTARGWAGAAIATTVLAVLAVAGGVLYEWPQLTVIPPEQIVAGATASIFNPARSALGSDSHEALVERGHAMRAGPRRHPAFATKSEGFCTTRPHICLMAAA